MSTGEIHDLIWQKERLRHIHKLELRRLKARLHESQKATLLAAEVLLRQPFTHRLHYGGLVTS